MIVWTQVGLDTDWALCECGENHTMAVKTDGTLWSTGNNFYGQLGVGDNITRTSFTQIPGNWSEEGYLGLPQFSGGNGQNANTCHSAAIKSSKHMYGAGYNYYGQLGVGNRVVSNTDMIAATESIPVDGYTDNWVFVSSGDDCSAAIKETVTTYVESTISTDEPQVWNLP